MSRKHEKQSMKGRPASGAVEPGANHPVARRPGRLWRSAFLAAVGLMTMSAALAVGLFMGYVQSLPPIEQLENYAPPEITRVTDRDGALDIGEFKVENRQVVRVEEMPARLKQAFIAIEDSRFYKHIGVDLIGIFRAVVENLKAGRIAQGASTITMQLTRNILPIGREKKPERKLIESILAIQIERRYSKDQILEFYLNHIAFSHNAFGVKAAAATYFAKDLNDLTLGECAVLAGIPKATTRYNPRSNPDRALGRRNVVLRAMADQGMISEEDFQAAQAEPLQVRTAQGRTSRYPYFLDALERDLKGYYGLSDKDLNEGGLRIISTLDPAIQDACVDALREGLLVAERMVHEDGRKQTRHLIEQRETYGDLKPNDTRLMQITSIGPTSVQVSLDRFHGEVPLPDPLPFYEPAAVIKDGAWIDVRVESLDVSSGELTGVFGNTQFLQGSIVVLDARSGEVLAMVGGRNFYNQDQLGMYNRAIQGGRQAGSCFKPFFFAAAFEKGIPPNGLIVDEPIQYGEQYRPVNYEPRFFGPTTLIEALQHSRNIVTLRLMEVMGIQSGVKGASRFDYIDDWSNWKIPPEVNVCLGTVDCSPLQLAAAYQVFANQGVGERPHYFRSIVDPSGRIQVPLKPKEQIVVDPIAAFQTQYLLRQAVAAPGGTGYEPIGQHFESPEFPPICGKTGTTSDCRDAWFAGFTPDLVMVVQVGYDTPTTLGPKMTGGRVAGPIWSDAFRRIIATRDDWKMEFDAPEGIEREAICAETGKRASAICRNYGHEIYADVPFRTRQAPREECNGVPDPPLIRPVDGEFLRSPDQGFDSYYIQLALDVGRRGLARKPTAQVETPAVELWF